MALVQLLEQNNAFKEISTEAFEHLKCCCTNVRKTNNVSFKQMVIFKTDIWVSDHIA